MTEHIEKYIDHTLLKPTATEADIAALCEQAREHGFKSVCVHPCHVQLCHRLLEGSDVLVCTVIGFPLGANETRTKAFEAALAVEHGADEVDTVINIGALKEGRLDYVRDDIRAVVATAGGRTVKVIIETFYLSDAEKLTAVRLACEAGADFVKTCTGFNAGVACASDVRLMKSACTNGVLVKASAGIRTREAAEELISAGADRLGTSAGVVIAEGSAR